MPTEPGQNPLLDDEALPPQKQKRTHYRACLHCGRMARDGERCGWCGKKEAKR